MASTAENNLNPDTSIGLSFPLGFIGSRMFNTSKTIEVQAQDNLKSLVLSNIGERPLQPEFGSKLLSVVFEFKDETLIEEVIKEAGDQWLPYITINEVITVVDAINPNRLNVSIDFSVATSPDATDQITLDFNTTG